MEHRSALVDVVVVALPEVLVPLEEAADLQLLVVKVFHVLVQDLVAGIPIASLVSPKLIVLVSRPRRLSVREWA